MENDVKREPKKALPLLIVLHGLLLLPSICYCSFSCKRKEKLPSLSRIYLIWENFLNENKIKLVNEKERERKDVRETKSTLNIPR
jgi:hypothetical protein